MDPITHRTISEHSTTEQGLAQSNTSEHFLISFNPYIHINFGEKQMRFMELNSDQLHMTGSPCILR